VELKCPDGSEAYGVVKGDSCWAIAERRGAKVGDLERLNEGLDCNLLGIGVRMCVPMAN